MPLTPPMIALLLAAMFAVAAGATIGRAVAGYEADVEEVRY